MFYNDIRTHVLKIAVLGGVHMKIENSKERKHNSEVDYCRKIIEMVKEINNQEFLESIYYFVKVMFDKSK